MRDNAARKDAQIREASTKQLSNGAAKLQSLRVNGAQERDAFAKQRSDRLSNQSSTLSDGAQRGDRDHSNALNDLRRAFRYGLRSEKCLHVQCSALKKRGKRLSNGLKKRPACATFDFDPGTSPLPLPSECGNPMLHKKSPPFQRKYRRNGGGYTLIQRFTGRIFSYSSHSSYFSRRTAVERPCGRSARRSGTRVDGLRTGCGGRLARRAA